MAPERLAALDARVNALDHDAAQRVLRLVAECGASLDVALLAIQEADRAARARGAASLAPERRLRGLRALFSVLR